MGDTRFPISCCLIVRDEEANIARCLESVRPWVRQIVLVDTGSADRTVELARPFVDTFEVFTACNDSEGRMADFGMARQRSLDLAREEWVIWVDGDDVLEGGEFLGEVIKRAPASGPPWIFAFPYDYDPSCQQYRERLFRRGTFKWHGPIHETLVPVDAGAGNAFEADDRVTVKHNRAGKVNRDPGRNIRILEKLYAEDGEKDARFVFYLGRELSYVEGQKDRAIDLLSRFVELSGWDEERSLACMRLSELHVQHVPRRPRDVEQAIFWGLRSIAMTEDWGEPYFAVARAFSEKAHQTGDVRDWKRCVHYAMAGLGKPPTRTVLFVNPHERAVDIHRYLNVALNRVGDVQAALKSVKAALEVVPGDSNLDYNRKVYSNHIARERLVSALSIMVDTGKLSQHMADTALACADGRAESYAGGTPEAARAAAGLSGAADGAAVSGLIRAAGVESRPGDRVTQIGPYRRPPNYPRGVTEADFPHAAVAPHPQAWLIPASYVLDDLPLRMTDGQLEALTLALWKEYVLHDEMLSAVSLLEKAPYRVRHSVGVGKALSWTEATMAWMDDPEDEQKTNAPADVTVECGVPLPGPLTGQLLGRSELVTRRLLAPEAGERILDFGCSDGSIANRWGLKGYNVTGVDLCSTSIALARRKADEFDTGVSFVCCKFSDLSPEMFPGIDVVTSTDTYEHVKDGVRDLILPARLQLGNNPKGRMILVTPYGAWMRGAFLAWAHPWRWADEPRSRAWNAGEKRVHLIAPTPWTVAADFRADGWWVKDSFAVMCDVQDTPGQGNVVCEAHLRAPWETLEKLHADVESGRDPLQLDVVFSTGDAWQEWNPLIMRGRGIGGSETAVVEMAKRLAHKGHRVRVYGSCGRDGEGIYDGVEYRQAHKVELLDLEDPADVLVAWRSIPLLASAKAKIKLLWVHDVYAMGGPDGLLLEADRVLALSEWHKGNLVRHHGLAPEHVHVTRNGIDLSRFKQEGHDDGCMHTNDPSYGRPWKCAPGCPMARDPHKVIYSSSPDRGLESLLLMWQRIRAQVPDATLHVFYGTDLWKACAASDPALQSRIGTLEHNLKLLEKDGVVMRGKVDQLTLAREMLSAGVWAYPTWFSETSCCHPDTQVSVPGDHRGGPPTVSIKSLVGKKGFPVYAYNEKENRFQLATCKRVWRTKRAKELIALHLDDGKILKLTPEHLVLTFDGEWVQAGTLVAGDRLRALHYRYNVAIRDANGRWTSESRLVGEWIKGRPLRRDEHVDHEDRTRLDNRPESLTVMSAHDHASKTHAGKVQSKKHEQRRMVGWRAWAQSEEGQRELSARSTRIAHALWARVNALPTAERTAWLKRRHMKRKETEQATGRNHQIVAVSRLPGCDVYDMEVEGLHNFVADGVVVHNCITAMEAQAGGLRIVTSPIAALKETAKDAAVFIDGDWLSQGYQDRFVEAVVSAMTTESHTWNGMHRDQGIGPGAMRFSWDGVAEKWEALFYSEISRKKTQPLAPYSPARHFVRERRA